MKHIYDNQNGNQNNNQKPSEERFTERFKEVASNYEPTFEPADWSAMQSKLAAHNEKDHRRVVFRRLATFAAMGAAAVIVVFFGYQFLDNSTTIRSEKTLVLQENSIQKANLIKSNSSNETNIQNDLNQDLEKNSKNFTKPNSKTKTIESNKNSQIAQTNSESTSLSNSQTNSKEKINLTNNSLLTENKTFEQAESNKILSILKLDLPLDLKLEKTNFNLFVNIEPKQITLPELKVEENLIASNQNKELIRKNPVVSAIGKWRIGAALMAMTNIYKSNDKKRMNYANGYGLMADYQFAKRFNISAGAIYTEKRIDIEEPLSTPTISNSFNPNDNAWVKKNKTQMNWQVVDLPIHLRYTAIQTNRNKWFVSAGTSNYFFLKENYESDYTVSFQDIYDPRLTRSQEIVRQRETQSALQLFATINVSVGIETSLGKHLTLQVEPYWRFPVRSLGSEGVFVQTGGLLTRINFAL